MKLRMMSFWLALIMLLSVSPTYSYASENENQGEVVEITEDDPATLNAAEYTEWYAVTMQGDTESPSDCKAFEYTMTLCNDGYEYSRCGWTVNSSGTADFDGSIVTQSQFVNAKYYDVAYYSGHGGFVWDTEREINKPCLNYLSSDSQKILVADAFDILESDWASTTVISPSTSLRVLVLASCEQLNDTNAKYYARLMKVSSIRVIPGYYGTAPSVIDVRIATDFVNNCNNGNSIAGAWSSANSNQPWAVLVYFSNNNQYYRMPGFPGAIYSAPASNADVYIMRQDVNGATTVTTAAQPGTGELLDAVAELPLTILTSDSSTRTAVEEFSREAVWTSAVSECESVVRKALASELSDIDNKLLVEYHVTKEVVDPDMGVLSETCEIIERTYRYYDTFNGIKIADSFVGGSVDGQGLSKITVQKKTVVSDAVAASATAAGAAARENTVSDAQALKLLLAECPSMAEDELQGISLAYAPDGSGSHVLAYEFLIGGCFYYVSVTAGEVLWF